MKNAHIIVLEDSADDLKLMELEFEKASFDIRVSHASSGAAFESLVANGVPDAVISDFNIPGYDIAKAQATLKNHSFSGPFILVTGALIDQQAVDLLVNNKIDDYILKGNLLRLVPALERELKRCQLKKEVRQKNKQLERLSRVASHTHNGVIITNADGYTIWINKACQQMTGYSLKEFKREKPGDLLQGEGTDPETVKRISQKLKQEIPFTEEILNYSKSGTPYWIKLDITPIVDEDGELEQFIAIQEDITAEKVAKIALQKRTAQLSSIINNLNSVIYEYELSSDGSQETTYVSEGTEALWGLSKEQVLENFRSIFEHIHPDDVKPLEAAFEESAANLSLYDHTFRYIMPATGKIKYLRDRGNPKSVRDKVVWTTTSIDDTEKVLSQKYNDVLLSEVHHRVKNNLAIISGLLQLEIFELKDEIDILPMQRSINRIQSMAHVHELLYKNKSLTNVNIKEYLEQLSEQIKRTFSDDRKISIHLDLENIELNVNEAIPLGMLLNELLTNSFKYAFDGDGGIIKITFRDINEHHEVVYYDNGKGFKKDFCFEDAKTLGMTVIHMLLEQLEADFEYNTNNQFELKMQFKAKLKGAHSNI
jgi:PAS domain S-box-containing protein